MKVFFYVLSLLIGVTAAQASQFEKNHQIRCEEYTDADADGSGSNDSLGSIQVQLNAHGQATEMKIQRKRSDHLKALNLKLGAPKSKITHEVLKNSQSLVPATAKIETILVSDKKGDSVKLSLNDHLSSGNPVSTLEIVSSGKSLSTDKLGHTLICDGQLRLPMKTTFKDPEILK
jgi:hypothetical protein